VFSESRAIFFRLFGGSGLVKKEFALPLVFKKHNVNHWDARTRAMLLQQSRLSRTNDRLLSHFFIMTCAKREHCDLNLFGDFCVSNHEVSVMQ